MAITVTCPSCSQLCQVDDQHAGAMVKCPSCGNVTQVTRPAEAVRAGPPPATPVSPAAAPGGMAGQGLMDVVKQSATTFGLDSLSTKLIYVGMGCLAGMVLFTFLPWISVSSPTVTIPGANVNMPVFSVSVTRLGISIWQGILNLLLSVGALAFLIVTFLVIKKKETFDIALWVAGGWSAVAVLWRLINVAQIGQFSGFGLILTLLCTFGAVGAFGFIIFQRFVKGKRI